ncbi:MAG: MG2 domain-containing protein [Pseudomonadota bacterium]
MKRHNAFALLTIFAVLYTLSTLAFSVPAPASLALPSLAKIESFSPQGEVKAIRQITAHFSEPMVSFGNPQSVSPFSTHCLPKEINGVSHWLDTKTWVYDFEHDLPAGVKCEFLPLPGLKSLNGLHIEALKSYHFNTGGSQVKETLPSENTLIDEQQFFILKLDGEVDPKSVYTYSSCAIDGIGERIPLLVIEGTQREQILREQLQRSSYFFENLLSENASSASSASASILKTTSATVQKISTLYHHAKLIVAQCSRKLPSDAKISLVWGAGIRSLSGLSTTKDQTLPFTVRPDFIAKMQCTKTSPNAGCNPFSSINLYFSSPVPQERLTKISLKAKTGQVFLPTFDKNNKFIDTLSFNGKFPENSVLMLDIPQGLTDDNFRKLSNAAQFPMQIIIDEAPPLIKFSSLFGILEVNAQPALPVSIRNVENSLPKTKISSNTLPSTSIQPTKNSSNGLLMSITGNNDKTLLSWIQKAQSTLEQTPEEQMLFEKIFKRSPHEGELSLLHGKTLPFPTQSLHLPLNQSGKTLELVGIPLPKPGFYIVEFASPRLGQALLQETKPYYAYSSALVTNLSVHFKKGRESSLVWVTTLDQARSVANALVQISDCQGNLLWKGQTNAQGIAHVEQPLADHEAGCTKEPSGFFITARKGNDLSFAFSSWNQGISRWEFNLRGGISGGGAIAHTVLDRPLFRAGETVSMKHFIRLPTQKGLSLPTQQPNKIEISHQGSDQRYEVPVSWKNNAGFSTWSIPKEAKLGTYAILLKTANDTLRSSTFRVEQFRVPLMKAVLKAPDHPILNSDKLNIDAQLNYINGGAASDAPIKIRSKLEAYTFEFPDYSDFIFGGKAPQEGIHVIAPYSYSQDNQAENDDDVTENTDLQQNSNTSIRTRSLTLDAKGGSRISFNPMLTIKEPKKLDIEMEYDDPNGQRLTTSTHALILPSSLIVGLQTNSQQGASKDHLAFKVIVLNPLGKPLNKRRITVEAYRKTTYAYRKRLLGGFYTYEQTEDVKKLGTLCKGETDQRGLLFCTSAAPQTGEIILVAQAEDDQKHSAVASASVYVADENTWYSAAPSDRIDIIATRNTQQRSYEPGETARFEVRMPFREATALISIEREGVLTAWTTPITAKTPFIDVPILESYGPNAYVSVMVVRGRIDPESTHAQYSWLKKMMLNIQLFFGLIKEMPKDHSTYPTAFVDLTKPAFKLGVAEIQVGWKKHTLNVKVEAERASYKVRDRAIINIQVTDHQGKPAAQTEVALAAVDEGLLALSSPSSWSLLNAMMERRALEVETATAQSQVIGKRHFGKKAAPPGGGGGSSNTRELFDTLLSWNPAIMLDAKGQARIEIPLKDSLSSFRIEAIAHKGIDQFGSGHTTIRTTQDVMILPGLPPFVREGDQFDATLTLRNSSSRHLNLNISAQTQPRLPLKAQHLSLAPGKATTVSFPVVVPLNTKKLDWLITAQEIGLPSTPNFTLAKDSLKVSQDVGETQPVSIYQQSLEQLEPSKPFRLPVQLPASALSGRGGIEIAFTSSLGGSTASLQEWIKQYPYNCLEQQSSRAIILQDVERWKQVMNILPAYLDKEGLAQYFPVRSLEGSDSLTAYLLSIADEAGWEIPANSRHRMLKGLQDFVAGRIHRYGPLASTDLILRKLSAIESLARYKLAQPEMLESIEINPNLWPTSTVLDWLSILSRMPEIPQRDKQLAEVRQILRSRLMLSGTTLNFSTEQADRLWWLMQSADTNVLRALMLVMNDSSFKTELPKLMRGALARQQQGHWDTTLANAWGTLALRRFQAIFEKGAITGITTTTLNTEKQTFNWKLVATPAAPLSNKDTLAPIKAVNAMSAASSTPNVLHINWPATPTPLILEHQGNGKPWAFIRSKAAIPTEKPLFLGYRITRTLYPIEQQKKNVWTLGDTYRVSLTIDAQTDMTWVVVDDPIPAGATILGSGLGGDSKQLASGRLQLEDLSPTFEERTFDSFRAYYAFIPKGTFKIEYTVRLNNAGRFKLPPSRAQAMYAPEIFGILPNSTINIQSPSSS